MDWRNFFLSRVKTKLALMLILSFLGTLMFALAGPIEDYRNPIVFTVLILGGIAFPFIHIFDIWQGMYQLRTLWILISLPWQYFLFSGILTALKKVRRNNKIAPN